MRAEGSCLPQRHLLQFFGGRPTAITLADQTSSARFELSRLNVGIYFRFSCCA